MAKVTCSKCNGNGLYKNPSSHGPYCFPCKGTGQVNERKERPAKVVVLSPTVKIADRCGGDPTKLDLNNTRALDYLGLSADDLLAYRELWNAGIREVAR